jgi:UbiD family decarboxylase
MRCDVKELKNTWINAINNPIEPKRDRADAPCHDVVFEGDDLLNGNGLDAIPVPISSPGWDNAPYFSSSHFITKDPHTGVQNMGNYRGMVKAPNAGRDEPVDRAAHRWLHALARMEKAWQADAGRRCHRRATRRVVHGGAEGAGIAR